MTIDGSTPRIQMKPTADEQSHRIEFFNTADSIVSRIYGDPATGSLSLEVGTAGNETAVKCIKDAGVEIHHDGSKKLESTSTGVSVTGTISATSVATSANGIRNITTSTADPTSSDGANGDIWLKYTA